jgi:hypothetical protein
VPESIYGGIYAAVKFYVTIGPEDLANFLSCDNFSRMLHQEHQELKQLSWEANPQALFTDFPGSPVQFNPVRKDA